MASSEPAPSGTIYDLGYQHYDGPRLGRSYALWSLYLLSVRNSFGFGRGALPKVLAIGLVLLAIVPALIQLLLAAVVPVEDFEFVQPHEYYGFIQVIIILFVAALASDLVGNDRRNGTLALYFSRPILRDDYALAKIVALGTSLLAITVFPQLVMFTGNWLGAADSFGWFKDNASDLAPIVISGLLVCLMFGAIGVLIASYAERRSFALISVLAIFLISLSVVQVVVSIVDGVAARYAVFLSPVHVMRGFTLFLFDALPPLSFNSQEGNIDDQIAFADFPGIVYVLAALAYAGAASAVTVRRYRGSI